MLSPFDPIYLVPTYLFAQFYCAESSDYLWHWKWSGSLKQIMGVLVATLSSVSGYVLALRQDASGCVWWQHWALSLAMFWHWGKMHLVAFQHKAEMVSQLSCVIFVLMSTSRHSWWRRCLVPPRGADSSATTIKQRVLRCANETDHARIAIPYFQDEWIRFIVLRHWALSLATFWHWDKKRLVAFQHIVTGRSSLSVSGSIRALRRVASGCSPALRHFP
jgi:hypothetical protein